MPLHKDFLHVTDMTENQFSEQCWSLSQLLSYCCYLCTVAALLLTLQHSLINHIVSSRCSAQCSTYFLQWLRLNNPLLPPTLPASYDSATTRRLFRRPRQRLSSLGAEWEAEAEASQRPCTGVQTHSVSARVAPDSGVVCLHALKWQEAWVKTVSTGSVGSCLCMTASGWLRDLFGLSLLLGSL